MRQFIKIKFTFLIFFISSLLFFAGSLFSGCEKSAEKRIYDEIAIPPSQYPNVLLQEMLARGEDPHAFLKGQAVEQSNDMESIEQQETLFSWNVPSGWYEQPAGGMRLASFRSQEYPGIDVSIVSLGGIAGGISANVNRWLTQIHLPSLDDEALNQFLSKQKKFKTKSGLPVTFVDLTMLQEREDNNTQSGILAAMVEIPNRTVFVKMTGTVDDIDKNRAPFEALCQSLQLKHP